MLYVTANVVLIVVYDVLGFAYFYHINRMILFLLLRMFNSKPVHYNVFMFKIPVMTSNFNFSTESEMPGDG